MKGLGAQVLLDDLVTLQALPGTLQLVNTSYGKPTECDGVVRRPWLGANLRRKNLPAKSSTSVTMHSLTIIGPRAAGAGRREGAR